MKYNRQQVISILLGSPIGANRIFIIDPTTGKELASISQDGIISGQEYRINIDDKFVDISEPLRKIIDVNKQFKEIKAKIKNLDSSLSTTNKQVYGLETAVTGILAWQTALELRINPILANVGVLDAAVTALQGEVTVLTGRVDRCEIRLEDHDTRIEHLENRREGKGDVSVNRLVDGSLRNRQCILNVYDTKLIDYVLDVGHDRGILFRNREEGGDIIRLGHPKKNDKFVVIDKENDGKDLCGLTADGRVFARDGIYLWDNQKNEFRKEIPATYLGSGSLSVNDAIIEVTRCLDNDGNLQCITLIGNKIGITHQHMRDKTIVDAVLIGHKDKNNQFAIYDYENIHDIQGALIAQIAHDGVVWGRDYQRWNNDIGDFEDFFLGFDKLRSGRLKEHTLLTINDGLLINTEDGIEHIVNNNVACRIGSIDQPNRFLVIREINDGLAKSTKLLGGTDGNGDIYGQTYYVQHPTEDRFVTFDEMFEYKTIRPEQIISGSLHSEKSRKPIIHVSSNRISDTYIDGKRGIYSLNTDGKHDVRVGDPEENNKFSVKDVNTNKLLSIQDQQGYIKAQKYFIANGDEWKEFRGGDIAINNVQDGNIKHRYMFYNKEIATPRERIFLEAFIDKNGVKEEVREIPDGGLTKETDDIRIGDENKPNQFIVRNKQTGVIDSTISETGVITGRGFGVINSITGQPSASIDNDGNIVCRSINTTEEGGGDSGYNKHPVFHDIKLITEDEKAKYFSVDKKEIGFYNYATGKQVFDVNRDYLSFRHQITGATIFHIDQDQFYFSNYATTELVFDVNDEHIIFQGNRIADKNGIKFPKNIECETLNAKKIKADEIIGEKRTFDKTRTKELEILEKIFTSNKKIDIDQERINVGNIDIKHEGHYHGSIHLRDKDNEGALLNKDSLIIRKYKENAVVYDAAIINHDSIILENQISDQYDNGERAYLGKDKLTIDKKVSFGMARSPSETLKITAIPVSGSNEYEKVDLLNVKIHRWTQEMCPSLTLYNLKAELFDRKKIVVTELFKVDYETIKFWGNTIADKDGVHISQAKDLIVDDKLRLNQNNNTFFQADRDKIVYNNINNNELFKVDKNYLSFNGNKIADSEGIISPLSCIKCETLEEKISTLEEKLKEQDEKITELFSMFT